MHPAPTRAPSTGVPAPTVDTPAGRDARLAHYQQQAQLAAEPLALLIAAAEPVGFLIDSSFAAAWRENRTVVTTGTVDQLIEGDSLVYQISCPPGEQATAARRTAGGGLPACSADPDDLPPCRFRQAMPDLHTCTRRDGRVITGVDDGECWMEQRAQLLATGPVAPDGYEPEDIWGNRLCPHCGHDKAHHEHSRMLSGGCDQPAARGGSLCHCPGPARVVAS